jgi:hypothetical protein
VYNSAYRLRFPAFGLRAAPLRAVRSTFVRAAAGRRRAAGGAFDFFPIFFPIRFPILGRGGLPTAFLAAGRGGFGADFGSFGGALAAFPASTFSISAATCAMGAMPSSERNTPCN